MKAKIPLLLCIGTLLPGLTGLAEPAPHHETTTWIDSPVGSHLGSGYVSSYLTNIRGKTIARDDARLRQAIKRLDALGMVEVRGFGLLPAAVAWQAQTSIRKLVAEQAETGLSYGELLLAHTLARKSKHEVGEIVAMRTTARSWGQLAGQLGVSPDLLVLGAEAACDRIRLAQARSGQRAQRDSSLQSTNPSLHHYFAIH